MGMRVICGAIPIPGVRRASPNAGIKLPMYAPETPSTPLRIELLCEASLMGSETVRFGSTVGIKHTVLFICRLWLHALFRL